MLDNTNECHNHNIFHVLYEEYAIKILHTFTQNKLKTSSYTFRDNRRRKRILCQHVTKPNLFQTVFSLSICSSIFKT